MSNNNPPGQKPEDKVGGDVISLHEARARRTNTLSVVGGRARPGQQGKNLAAQARRRNHPQGGPYGGTPTFKSRLLTGVQVAILIFGMYVVLRGCGFF